MSKIKKSEKSKVPAIITENTIKSFYKIIKEFAGGNNSIVIEFKNGSEITLNNLDDLFTDTNYLGNQINKLRILGSNGKIGHDFRYAAVYMYDVNLTYSINYEAEGDKSDVLKFCHEAQNIVRYSENWYGFMYYSDYLIIMIAGIIGMLITWLITGKLSFSAYLSFSLYLIAVVAIFFGRKHLFPRMIFYIGAGIKREDLRRNISNLLFVVVLLGIIVSIVATYITDYMKNHP